MTRRNNYTERCPVCESLFFPVRSDAVYCSAKCRQKAKRLKINNSKNATQALYQDVFRKVNELASLEAYNQLRTLILNSIEHLPDEKRKKVYEAIEDDFFRLR